MNTCKRSSQRVARLKSHWQHMVLRAPLLLALLFTACSSDDSSATFGVGGTVTGLSGTVVLQNTGGDDLTITENGAFVFVTPLADGSAYAVTILTQPSGQTCKVSDGAGAIAGAGVTNVGVNCKDTPASASCLESGSAADYTVTFSATWSATTHPSDPPPNPHFSRMVGSTHADGYVMWEDGGIASDGIEAMAELGATDVLSAEIDAAIAAGTAGKLFVDDEGLNPSPGTASVNFQITGAFPLVSLVTMVAPSPDWFVGVHGVNLCQDGEWVSSQDASLQPYDAGSDSGVTFTSDDADVAPHDPISQITGFPFEDGQGAVPPLGTFTFDRQ